MEFFLALADLANSRWPKDWGLAPVLRTCSLEWDHNQLWFTVL